MTQRERVLNELQQMDDFVATMKLKVSEAVIALEVLKVEDTTAEDSKSVGAYKRKRLKKFNAIIDRAIKALQEI